jgi:cell division protein FtsB
MNQTASAGARSRAPQMKASLVACGLTLLFSVFGLGLYSLCIDRQAHFEDKLVELDALKADRRKLLSHNERMRDRVAYLKTDAGVEEIAREKLGLIRPGELAYAVVPAPPESFMEEDEKESPHLDHVSHVPETPEDFGLIVAVLRHLFGPPPQAHEAALRAPQKVSS